MPGAFVSPVVHELELARVEPHAPSCGHVVAVGLQYAVVRRPWSREETGTLCLTCSRAEMLTRSITPVAMRAIRESER